MNRKMEEIFFQNYLEFFRLAEERRRWNMDKSIPWEQVNPEASDLITDIIETFSWVEAFLPDYTSSILQCVRRSRGRAWFSANWGYEESKHSLTLEQWLLRTGKRKEGEVNQAYEDLSVREWHLPFDHPREMMIYTMIQELATWVNYMNLKKLAEDEGDLALARALHLIAAEERCHYNFFRKGVKVFMEFEPRETVDDLKHVFENFHMPAKYEIEDYEERATRIAKAGIYGPRDYLKRVRDPILADLGLTKDDLK